NGVGDLDTPLLSLVGLGARFYSPDTGRFISPGPPGTQGTALNLYQYAGNNPIAPLDPSGPPAGGMSDGPPGRPCQCPLPGAPQVPTNPETSADVVISFPVDPNYIFGPAGFGSQNYVSVDQVLPYTILFENEPDALFPARQVTI